MCKGSDTGMSLVCSRKSQEAAVTGPGRRGDQQEMASGVGGCSQGLEPQGVVGKQDWGFHSAYGKNSLEGYEWGTGIHVF